MMLKLRPLINEKSSSKIKLIITENQYRELCNRIVDYQVNNIQNLKIKTNEKKKLQN